MPYHLRNAIARLALCLAVGPVVGGLSYLVALPLLRGGDISVAMLAPVLMLLSLPYFLFFSFMLGGPTALIWGLAFSFIAPRISSRSWRLLIAAILGALTVALWIVLTDHDWGFSEPGIAMTIGGAIAGAACSLSVDCLNRRLSTQARAA